MEDLSEEKREKLECKIEWLLEVGPCGQACGLEAEEKSLETLW